MEQDGKVAALERKVAEILADKAVLEDELCRYKALVDQASDLIHSVTPEGRFLYVNEAWKKTLGYTDEDILDLRLMNIIDPSCKDSCNDIFNCLLKGDPIDRNKTAFIAKNGSKIHVEGCCRTHFQDEKAFMVTGIFRNIAEQTRQEEALLASENRYHDLFENAHDLIQIIAPDGKILFANRSWRQTFGYSDEDLEWITIFDLISDDCKEHCKDIFQKIITDTKVHDIGSTFQSKDGRKILIEGNAKCKFEDGQPVYSQCILHDVTEKRKMETELFKAQKLESIGVFAGGIAHDFNNLLTAILGNVSMAKFYLDKEHLSWSLLGKTENATLQAKNLTQQLLTFSKGGAPIRKTTSVNKLLQDSISFTLRGSSVKVEYQLSEDLWPIQVDPGQLSQVTQNLALNASQAMVSGGTFIVTSETITMLEDNQLSLTAGPYVHLSFQDQGHGISAENLTKIFDPYFSSKTTGSGLGLAVSYSIIKQHEGLITAVSEVGKGTTFHIYLPAAIEEEQAADEQDEIRNTASGKILFMDDEEHIIELAELMLSELKWVVEVARHGEEAVEKYKEAMRTGQPFDGVIMDLTIKGGMGGKETIGKLQEIDPDVKAIVSSGYANDPIMAHYKEHGFVGVVPKPYRMVDLSRCLEKLV